MIFILISFTGTIFRTLYCCTVHWFICSELILVYSSDTCIDICTTIWTIVSTVSTYSPFIHLDDVCTVLFWAAHAWNTVRRAWGKLSKVLLLVWVSSKLNFPPNTCIPSREKMMMNRKSSSSREAMDFMELSRDATKLLSDCQWLRNTLREREE